VEAGQEVRSEAVRLRTEYPVKYITPSFNIERFENAEVRLDITHDNQLTSVVVWPAAPAGTIELASPARELQFVFRIRAVASPLPAVRLLAVSVASPADPTTGEPEDDAKSKVTPVFAERTLTAPQERVPPAAEATAFLMRFWAHTMGHPNLRWTPDQVFKAAKGTDNNEAAAAWAAVPGGVLGTRAYNTHLLGVGQISQWTEESVPVWAHLGDRAARRSVVALGFRDDKTVQVLVFGDGSPAERPMPVDEFDREWQKSGRLVTLIYPSPMSPPGEEYSVDQWLWSRLDN
jgi:hypothetical protein